MNYTVFVFIKTECNILILIEMQHTCNQKFSTEPKSVADVQSLIFTFTY